MAAGLVTCSQLSSLNTLLVGISPVVNLVIAEVVVGDGLKWRARKVQREAAVDVAKRRVGARRVHALVRLVNHQ